MATRKQDLEEYARALSRARGSKGGKARAAALSPEERTAIARRAAIARWQKAKEPGGPVAGAACGERATTLRRDELRAMCAEIIATRNDDRDVRRSGTCIAFAAIIPELLDELERAEAERDRVIATCISESCRGSPYGYDWFIGDDGGGSAPTEAEAVAAVRRAAGLDRGRT